MLERDIPRWASRPWIRCSPRCLLLIKLLMGVLRAYARGFYCVPPLEDFRHRRGHRHLRLLRIPAREDGGPQQRLIGTGGRYGTNNSQ